MWSRTGTPIHIEVMRATSWMSWVILAVAAALVVWVIGSDATQSSKIIGCVVIVVGMAYLAWTIRDMT
jgi:hypothetical protein